MNSRINLLKTKLKDNLKKRVSFKEDEICFLSIPYTINIIGEGIEDYSLAFLNLTLDKLFLFGFIEDSSLSANVYDYNKAEIYEISYNQKNRIKDDYSAILSATINSLKHNLNLTKGITGCFYDDFHSSSLSSHTIKFLIFLQTIYKVRNLNLDYEQCTSILSDTKKDLLSINLDNNEDFFFRKNLLRENTSNLEELNYNFLKDIKILQISFKEKKFKDEKESQFLAELKQSYELLKVLMASARKKEITDFTPEEIKSFIRRLSPEKQKSIKYLHNEYGLLKKSIHALRSKDIESFINTINSSNSNLLELNFADEKIVSFLEELNKMRNIYASRISLKTSSISLFVHADFESLGLDEIKRKISIHFPEKNDIIKIYSSSIDGINIFERS